MPQNQNDEASELIESINALARVDRKLADLKLKIATGKQAPADDVVKGSARQVKLDTPKGWKPE